MQRLPTSVVRRRGARAGLAAVWGIAAALLLGLGACGQKGPLMLPQPAAAASAASAASASSAPASTPK